MTKSSLTVKMMTSREVQRMWMCTGRSGRFRGNELKETFSLATKKNAERREDDLITCFMAVNIVVSGSYELAQLTSFISDVSSRGTPSIPVVSVVPISRVPLSSSFPFFNFLFPFFLLTLHLIQPGDSLLVLALLFLFFLSLSLLTLFALYNKMICCI